MTTGPTTPTRPDGAVAWETEAGWVICAQIGGQELRAQGASLAGAEGLLHLQGRQLGATWGLTLSASLSLGTLLVRLREATP